MHLATNIPRGLPSSGIVIVKRSPGAITPIDTKGFGFTSPSHYSEEITTTAPPSITPSSSIRIVSPTEISTNASVTTANVTSSVPWYKSTQSLLMAAGILTAVLVLGVIPAAIAVSLSRNPTVVSTISPFIERSATWNFDNSGADVGGIYNATIPSPSTYSTLTYFGQGTSAAVFTASGNPIIVSTPFFNLSYTSFTIEAWIFVNVTTGDNALLSQCECMNCPGRCFGLLLRNGRMYMALSLNVLMGNALVAQSTWCHIAYVYDYSTRTQLTYVQGNLDASKDSSDPYQGESGPLIIGNSNLTSSLFDGYIDVLKITTRAKTAAEILTSATLVAYFSFDANALTDDQGPNKILAYRMNAVAINGRVGRALLFSGSFSMFQVYSVWPLSQPNRDFSITLWVYPIVASGTLIQKTRSQYSSTGACCIYMAFSTTGQIVFSIPSSINTTQIYGPFLSVNQWTHLGYTYSSTNGVTMYIDGARYGSTGSLSYNSTGNNHDWLNVGWSPSPCTSVATSIANGFFQGAIDELYVYRREISATEISSLAKA